MVIMKFFNSVVHRTYPCPICGKMTLHCKGARKCPNIFTSRRGGKTIRIATNNMSGDRVIVQEDYCPECHATAKDIAKAWIKEGEFNKVMIGAEDVTYTRFHFKGELW